MKVIQWFQICLIQLEWIKLITNVYHIWFFIVTLLTWILLIFFSGTTPETKGTAFVVYEDIFDAKNACDHLSGFNVCNRYLVVLYYQSNKVTVRVCVVLICNIFLTLAMIPVCVKGQVVCRTVYGDMHHKDLIWLIVIVWYCILVPDFYLVLHGLWCQKNTLMY